ncbi:MAG TPA: hypothetical protein VMU68_11265 [Acidimicrobiales bacterium]|nr:hypothetical protein [Acidimicrobiales bacterium]
MLDAAGHIDSSIAVIEPSVHRGGAVFNSLTVAALPRKVALGELRVRCR